MAQAQTQTARRPGVNIFDESKPMWKIFLVFLIPLMISNILQSASQTFGYIYLGRMLGVNALAAVSAVFPVIFLLFSFLIGIGSGSTVLIGQAFGAKDEHRVKKVAGTVLGATMVFALVVMVVGTAFSPMMLQLLGTPAAILPQADTYAKIVFFTSPIIFPYIIYTTFLRGVGDSQTPLMFLVVSTILTIVVTPPLLAGWFGLPKMGVAGAAVSAMISQGIAFIALLVRLRMMRHPLAFDSEMARDMFFDTKILWQVIRIGVPTGIQVVMVSLAEIAVISFVNRFGASATAAYGAVNQIVSYVQFPAISISIAASIFGAQYIGARRQDLLNSVIRSGVGLSYAIGGILVAVCYLASYPLLGMFITEPHTLEVAHLLLFITLWSYLLFGNSAVLSGVMRSSGTVLWPTINGIAGIWLVEVPAAYILMQHYGLAGVWMGYPIAFAFVLSANFIYYHFNWRKKTHERLV